MGLNRGDTTALNCGIACQIVSSLTTYAAFRKALVNIELEL